ncbi:MAG TPA: phenylalanine--tRNA ligase beta subunit-related protein [Planctomycetaceae bacterium]|nr:phenylalanine--tRNA ligase beta subunit-related protein [Planctomycetaceae bacterium]
MRKLTFEIEAKVADTFPAISVVAFVVTNLRNAAKNLPDCSPTVGQVRECLNSAGVQIQNLVDDARISNWRSAVRGCGLNPSTYKGSAEQLVRRYLKGEGISTPLHVVNCYCSLSAKHIAPMGAYDIDRLPSFDLQLRAGRPDSDCFVPLGGNNNMAVTERTVVYAADSTVMCWAFNVRDSKQTCLTGESDTSIFFGEAISDVQRESMIHATTELKQILTAAGGVIGESKVADAASPAWSIELASA